MTTIQVAPTKFNSRILHLYSQGLPYHKIQKILKVEFDEDLDAKCLGEIMGEIKKEMGCATQFQMGWQYAHQTIQGIFESMKEDHARKLQEEVQESYLRGTTFGRDQALIMLSGRDLNKGVIAGLVAATFFWVVMIIAYYYVYLT